MDQRGVEVIFIVEIVFILGTQPLDCVYSRMNVQSRVGSES